MNGPENAPNVTGLRHHAEEKLRNRPELTGDSAEAMSSEAMQALIHELRVHQIELELQNEELRRTQAELDESRSRYFDLYDLAPAGYCTLNQHGLILESNLTLVNLLGVNRSSLTMIPFSHFIAPADQDLFWLHRHRLMMTGKTESCELRLHDVDGTSIWAQLVSNMSRGPTMRFGSGSS